MHRFFQTFLYGLLAACFALILELLFFGILPVRFFGFLSGAPEKLLSGSLIGLVLFAIIEEGARLLFLLRLHRNTAGNSLNTPPSLPKPFLTGLFFGAGFAGLEVLVGSLLGDLPPLIIFLPGTFLLHIALSIGMAYCVFGRSPEKRTFGLMFFWAVFLHFFYNFFIFLS